MNAALADRIAVEDVMHRYALAIDSKDWALLDRVFADRLTADFRSFGVKNAFEGTRAEWVANVRGTIDGMEATQHMMANHLYDIDGDRATGTTYIRALHVCRNDWGGDRYTIGGYYDVTMARQADGWRITTYALNVTWSEGDRHVLRAATRRGKAA